MSFIDYLRKKLELDEIDGEKIFPSIQKRFDNDHQVKIIRDAGIQTDGEYERKDAKTARQFRAIKQMIANRAKDAEKPDSKWKEWASRYQAYVNKHGVPRVPK